MGPTAEDCDERDQPSLSSDVTRRLVAHGERIVPGLSGHNPIAVYAGLRPATEYKDYQLYANPDRSAVFLVSFFSITSSLHGVYLT